MARIPKTTTDGTKPREAELETRLDALEARVTQLEQQGAGDGRDDAGRGVDPGDAVPEGVGVGVGQLMDAEARAVLEAIQKRIPGG